MLIYTTIFVFLLVLSYKYDIRQYKGGYDFWKVVVLIILILFAGLRSRIGIDSIRYEYKFNNSIPTLFTLFNKENITIQNLSQPVWFLFNSFCKTIYDSFVTVQLFHAVIFNILLFRFIEKNTNKVFIALLVIYPTMWWNFSFEILREALSVVIYLNALPLLIENKTFKYFAFTSIAIFTHWFSFIIIIITPLLLKTSRKVLLLSFTLFAVFILIIDTSSLNNYVIAISSFLSDDLSTRVLRYTMSESLGFINISFLGGLFILLVDILYPILVSSKIRADSSTNIYSKILLLYIVIIALRMKFLIFVRFTNYLDPILIVYTLNLLFNKSLEKVFLNYILVFWIIFKLNTGISNFYNPMEFQSYNNIRSDCRYIPYRCIFQDKDEARELFYYFSLGPKAQNKKL